MSASISLSPVLGLGCQLRTRQPARARATAARVAVTRPAGARPTTFYPHGAPRHTPHGATACAWHVALPATCDRSDAVQYATHLALPILRFRRGIGVSGQPLRDVGTFSVVADTLVPSAPIHLHPSRRRPGPQPHAWMLRSRFGSGRSVWRFDTLAPTVANVHPSRTSVNTAVVPRGVVPRVVGHYVASQRPRHRHALIANPTLPLDDHLCFATACTTPAMRQPQRAHAPRAISGGPTPWGLRADEVDGRDRCGDGGDHRGAEAQPAGQHVRPAAAHPSLRNHLCVRGWAMKRYWCAGATTHRVVVDPISPSGALQSPVSILVPRPLPRNPNGVNVG